jgi:hypothetical protein
VSNDEAECDYVTKRSGLGNRGDSESIASRTGSGERTKGNDSLNDLRTSHFSEIRLPARVVIGPDAYGVVVWQAD